MSIFVKIHNKIVAFHKSEDVSYELKNFYLVMSCSVPILLCIGFIFLLGNSNIALSGLCFFIAAYVVLGSIIATITNTQLRFSYYYCIFMNFFFTPSMFLLSEGIFFGMVMFFVLGIILTVVLLGRQKTLYFMLGFEFVFYVLLIIYTLFFKSKVYFEQTNLVQSKAIALSFFLVSTAVIFLFLYQNYIHREIRLNIEKDNMAIHKAENTKGRFLANMTHEIRTPMNAIIGMTDLILKENLTKNAREYSNTVKKASSQLLQIINNILEFSKLDSGRAELVNNVYSFRNMIEEIVSSVSKEYSNEDIKLHVFISKRIPDKLFGDEVRIKQVLRYLLFSPLTKKSNGTVNLEIDHKYNKDDCSITFNFRIASTGIGLTESEIVAIYNAYSNYDSRQKTDYNRTGLEISICQKILTMMKGDLRIESIEGIGTALELSFENHVVDESPIVDFIKKDSISALIYLGDKNQEYPWQRLVDECEIPVTYVNTPLSLRSALEKRVFSSIYIPDLVYPDVKEYIEGFDCSDKVFVITSFSHCIGDFGNCNILRHPVYLLNFLESVNGEYDPEKYKSVLEEIIVNYPYARVLCVDDSVVNLKVLTNILKEYEIIPTTCKSGVEALDVLKNNEFDLMLIDHKMPEMDGPQLVRAIKNLHDANSTAPMICATADFGPLVKENLIKEGFDDYIAKPINANYLQDILNRFLPEELKVVKKISTKAINNKLELRAKDETDPTEFKPELGLANLGGNKEAYLSVLIAYYREGIQKITDVPNQLRNGNNALYITNVHALKSSSATVGAIGILPMFKALEFAGKDGDFGFVNENNDNTFENFEKVIKVIGDYLVSEGVPLQEESIEQVDDREEVTLDVELLKELKGCILSMNLRRGEEIIDSLLSFNYGSEINSKIKTIKDNFDNFEYMEIKAIIEEIL